MRPTSPIPSKLGVSSNIRRAIDLQLTRDEELFAAKKADE
nr:MAG TPA: hypothetical protein [Caudoviricetes sp.]